MNKSYKFATIASLAAVSLLTACAGGGYANNNLAGIAAEEMLGVNPMGNAMQTVPATGAPGTTVQGATNISPLTVLEGAAINSVAQNMAGSVLNGQIGSQISPADQNFRLQQLGGLVQSGSVNQSQQWVNPQTGSTIAINPVGQAAVQPQTQQKCRNMQEVVTLQNGQSITENRQACLNSQTGQWTLVQ